MMHDALHIHGAYAKQFQKMPNDTAKGQEKSEYTNLVLINVSNNN